MDFCIWDKCNNKCLMCSNPDLPWFSSDGVTVGNYDYDKLKTRLDKRLKEAVNGKRVVDSVLFTGGEPTLQPKFMDLIAYLKDEYPDLEVGILSNGRIFSYGDFARRLMAYDGLYIGLSLYGYDAESHDAVTQAKGSFAQTVKGIRNVLLARNKSHRIELRTVISGMSYQHLDMTLAFINASFPDIDRVAMIFIEYEGQLLKHLPATRVTYADCARYLEKAYDSIRSMPDVRLFHFPLCALAPKFWPYVWRTLPETEVSFVPACRGCEYQKYCMGIHKTYLEHIGEGEFAPPAGGLKIIEDDGNFKHHPIKAVDSDK